MKSTWSPWMPGASTLVTASQSPAVPGESRTPERGCHPSAPAAADRRRIGPVCGVLKTTRSSPASRSSCSLSVSFVRKSPTSYSAISGQRRRELDLVDVLAPADRLVVPVGDLADELVGELVDRRLHVGRRLACAQRRSLEVDGRLGDLRVRDGRVLLHRELELDDRVGSCTRRSSFSSFRSA